MNSENKDLDGQVPDNSKIVLLIIDMISDFEFEDGAELFKTALPAARKIARLKKKAVEADIPVIYINNNFGKWREDFRRLVQVCLKAEVRGSKIANLLKPELNDYYVLKPKHSAFFSTSLELILKHLGAKTLILTGVTTDICILLTANDAYMRDFKLIVPKDCVAAVKPTHHKNALEYLGRVLKADICLSNEISLIGKTSEK
jgi:nicotinamidase-related amidase